MHQLEEEERALKEENIRLQRRLLRETQRREQLSRQLSESESSLEMDEERSEFASHLALQCSKLFFKLLINITSRELLSFHYCPVDRFTLVGSLMRWPVVAHTTCPAPPPPAARSRQLPPPSTPPAPPPSPTPSPLPLPSGPEQAALVAPTLSSTTHTHRWVLSPLHRSVTLYTLKP